MAKKFWKSKMFWVNLIAIIAIIIQSQTGEVVSLEVQASALAIVNLLLRAITNQPITW